ncbi:alpha/beta hydrolase family protein [Streptomyces sp. DSM 15324]|uniref:alpha/beta hydrolase family protein n=1 Tax=Streptomyces sp. DSM 15324 TaxID=1739111 RepID=UPI000749CDF0|nr:alpha/beta hydrolase [Streptomyces sp. DSM 15324]KUO06993.1 2,6-dihydroxypseudooxynicotine hydrolase [Streptomyces sp. DSM 15324]
MTAAVPGTASLSPLVAAQHRAMPFTRLTDCGMDPADARRLLADTAAGTPWQDAAATVAERQWERARSAEEAGHRTTARQAYRHASAAWMFAQMAHQTDSVEKRDLYARHTAATAALAPAVERVEIPHRDGRLGGWLCLPPAGEAQATVIVWGGLSGWGAAYLPVADAYTARGLACLLAEGPGQGESRLRHGLYVDERVTEGFARFVDLVEADPRLGGALGVQGVSFGGLFAAHLADADPRVGAVVVNGAPAAPTVPEFRTAREQMAAVVGTDELDRVTEVMDALRFDPAKHRITCPLLLLHGGRDPLARYEDQEPFLRAADPATATVRIWPDGEHTLYNHAAERDALTGDWFTDHLTGQGTPKG